MRPDNPDVMFVTDAHSGLHMSVDGGRTWVPSNQGISSRAGASGDAIPVFCATAGPNNPDTVWVGTQNLRGIFKSRDGGKTWTEKTRGIVFRQNPATARGQVSIEKVSPALFTANAGGKGVPAAIARVSSDGARSQLPVYQCGATPGSCVASPIDLGAARTR